MTISCRRFCLGCAEQEAVEVQHSHLDNQTRLAAGLRKS